MVQPMKCPLCHQDGAYERRRTETIGSGNDLLIIEGVVVITCPNCGNISYPAQSIRRMEAIRRDRATLARLQPVQVAAFDDERVVVPPSYAERMRQAAEEGVPHDRAA